MSNVEKLKKALGENGYYRYYFDEDYEDVSSANRGKILEAVKTFENEYNEENPPVDGETSWFVETASNEKVVMMKRVNVVL